MGFRFVSTWCIRRYVHWKRMQISSSQGPAGASSHRSSSCCYNIVRQRIGLPSWRSPISWPRCYSALPFRPIAPMKPRLFIARSGTSSPTSSASFCRAWRKGHWFNKRRHQKRDATIRTYSLRSVLQNVLRLCDVDAFRICPCWSADKASSV